jgi:hypothetical protein
LVAHQFSGSRVSGSNLGTQNLSLPFLSHGQDVEVKTAKHSNVLMHLKVLMFNAVTDR